MEERTLGRTGRQVSVIGMGCWQIGGSWGDAVEEEQALRTLHTALESGVTFFDTADVYGDGRSERLLGRLLAEIGRDRVTVATKMGRRANPHVPEAYTLDAFRAWNDRSRENLGVDTLDLVQLHCPPSPVYEREEVYDALDTLVQEGRTRAYGVSVETVDEALTALRRPGVATIQIILNVFRRKPLEEVLPAAAEAGVGIIARVPLASGLLSGQYDHDTRFDAEDHRSFNRNGEQFDQGETFSGVPYDVGVDAAREVAAHTPEGLTTAQLALRWVVDQPGVSVVIPGARTPEHARANAAAGDAAPLTDEQQHALAQVYDDRIREHVHTRW
ncbi:aldo/keto reductase [Desertihabitans brevis]|uniref:Aldo/keto reductase n=1 Tax=Desertihabitans brevis TaxID=2268447 RepID=A0A367YRN6_9ACTN|nr:aldo/keto reductase [Desertihabitans brevis]RCK68555.1 aldo/keto reductase [Desertihabitans brevis]